MFKAEAKNFQSWAELEFDINTGVTLIDGVNLDDGGSSEGSGKSACLTAFPWGLYGRTPKDVGVDDVVREGEKGCHVRITLPNGLTVFRSRKPNDLYFCHDGGSPIRGKDAKETQKQITEALGMTFDAFCHVVYHSQNSTTQFLSSNQESKAKILSEMISLDVYDRARKVAHDREKEVLLQITRTESEYSLNLRDQEVLTGKIKLEEANHLHLTTQHETVAQNLSRNVESLKDEIQRQSQIHALIASEDADRMRAIRDALLKEQDKIEPLNKEVSKIEADLEALTPQLIDPQRVSKGREKLHQLKAELRTIDDSRAVRTQEVRLMSLTKDQVSTKKEEVLLLEKFVDNPNQDCPTCGTLLENCDTTDTQTKIVGLKKEIQNLEIQVNSFAEKTATDIPESEDLEKTIAGTTAALQKASEMQSKFDALEAAKLQTEGRIGAVKTSIEIHQGNLTKAEDRTPESLESMIRPLSLKLGEADAKMLTHLKNPPVLSCEVLDGLTGKLLDTKVEAEKCSSQVVGLRHDANILGELKSSFKTIKAYIFEALLVELNFKVAQYLEDLFEVQVSLSFQNDAGKIKAYVEMDGVERKLGLLSGGQFRRMSFAVNLALNEIGRTRNGSQLNLLILDEFFKDLSEVGMERCLLLLQKLDVPVVMVEHNSIFKSIIDQNFFVTLEGGVSRHAIESV